MDIQIQDSGLRISNGDFELASGIEEIKQQITAALHTFYGDWIPDYMKGVDYAYGLRHEEFLEFDIKNQISGVNGVLSVDDFQMEFDKASLTLKVTAGIKTAYGRLDVHNTINRG